MEEKLDDRNYKHLTEEDYERIHREFCIKIDALYELVVNNDIEAAQKLRKKLSAPMPEKGKNMVR